MTGTNGVLTADMQDESQNVELKLTSSGSMKPPTPPTSTVIGANSGGDDSGKLTNPDWGCLDALAKSYNQYLDSDINGALLAVVEEERLLREHINFPSYKFRLALTMARHSDIQFHLENAESASSIMTDALSIIAEIFPGSKHPTFTPSGLLKFIRDQDMRHEAKWRQIAKTSS